MILQSFSVLDKAVGAFLTPFFARATGEALRQFTEACNDEKHQFARHADDYILYRVGQFDDNSGFYTPLEPERLVSARESIIPADPFAAAPEAEVRRPPRAVM